MLPTPQAAMLLACGGVAINGGSMRVLIFLLVFMGALCFASRSASSTKKKPRGTSAVE